MLLGKVDNDNPEYMLIQTDDWVMAPDGQQYRNFAGKVRIYQDKDLFGFSAKGTANWYVAVGDLIPIIIAGCRCHYAIPLTNTAIAKLTSNPVYHAS